MARFLRDAFIGNWRNKGVALFFACTIWFVAYQSELQIEPVPIPVTLKRWPAEQMIIGVEETLPSGERAAFRDVVTAQVSGSRKQIDEFKKRVQQSIEVAVKTPAGTGESRVAYRFQLEDLNLPDPGVQVVSFEPAVVELTIDERAEAQLPVTAIYNVRESWEKDIEIVDPAVLRVSGPRGRLDKLRLIAEAPGVLSRDRFEKLVPVQVRMDRDESLDVRKWISFLGPEHVKLTVQLKVKQRAFSADALKVRFLLPALDYPVRIEFDEATIPVHFRGPEQEILRLEELIAGDPGFFVAVEVPSFSLSPGQEHVFTFTEDKLLLLGFSREIQKIQHERRQGKSAWQCTISPIIKETE